MRNKFILCTFLFLFLLSGCSTAPEATPVSEPTVSPESEAVTIDVPEVIAPSELEVVTAPVPEPTVSPELKVGIEKNTASLAKLNAADNYCTNYDCFIERFDNTVYERIDDKNGNIMLRWPIYTDIVNSEPGIQDTISVAINDCFYTVTFDSDYHKLASTLSDSCWNRDRFKKDSVNKNNLIKKEKNSTIHNVAEIILAPVFAAYVFIEVMVGVGQIVTAVMAVTTAVTLIF